MASKTMSKADIIDQVAKDADLSKAEAKAVLNSVITTISSNLKKGNKIQVTGFGTFEVRKRKARTGVNPSTQEKLKIPATKVPAFKPGAVLKGAVN